MSADLAREILRQCKTIGVLSVKLNWRGEATLHPDFPTIVKEAAALDFCDVMLNTNGSYSPAVAAACNRFVDTLIFSIDSLRPERAAVLRKPGNLSLVLRNFRVALLSRATTGRPNRIRINFTVQNENADELADMRAFAAANNVELHEKEVFGRTRFVQRLHGTEIVGRKNCGFPFQRLTIAWDGRVAPCCVPWDDSLIVGNINSESLTQIWKGKLIRRIRNDAFHAFYTHSTCVNCTSWASYRVESKKKLDISLEPAIGGLSAEVSA